DGGRGHEDLNMVRTAGARRDGDEGSSRITSRLSLDLEDMSEVRRCLEACWQLEFPTIKRRLTVGVLQDVLISTAGSGLNLHALPVEVGASVVVQVTVDVKGEHVLSERGVEDLTDVSNRMAAVRRLKAESFGLKEFVRIARAIGRDLDLSIRVHWTQDGSQKAHYTERQRSAHHNGFFHGFPLSDCVMEQPG